jgi:glycosyltransferase involved in cell wall biosynthesis
MFEQLRDLRDRYDYEVAAIVSAGEGKLIDKLRSENIPYHVVNFASGSDSPGAILGLLWSVVKLALLLRRERFDIVQSHVFATTITSRPAAWIADVPVRLAMIASPFHLQAYISRIIESKTWWMETKLIPSCNWTVELCRKIGVDEGSIAPVIYYSPDARNFDPQNVTPAQIRRQYGWSEDTPVICKVAYFYHRMGSSNWIPPEVQGQGHKGHEDLVKAAPIILNEFPNAKFLLVGSGWGPLGEAHLQEVKDLAQSLGLESSVIFPGYRPDANGILREANVAVQASLNENLGGAIEALMMSCPTVTTRVGGMVDIVRDEQTGVLVTPSNPSDLANGILQLLRNPERAQALGRSGRKLALEQFTLNRTVDDLSRLYQLLCSESRQQRKFYRLLVSLRRLITADPVFFYLVFKLIQASEISYARYFRSQLDYLVRVVRVLTVNRLFRSRQGKSSFT